MAPLMDEDAYAAFVNAYADWRISLFEPMKEYLDILNDLKDYENAKKTLDEIDLDIS